MPPSEISDEMNQIGRETSAVMRQMLQLATLVALRTREHGQKQAESRAATTNELVRDARETRIREAHEAKAKDPRGLEMGRIMDSNVPNRSITLDRADNVQRGSRDERPQYDSIERRDAAARSVYDGAIVNGRTPEEAQHLANTRHLLEIGQAQPAREATRVMPQDTQRAGNAREIEEKGRARERG